MKDKDFKKFCNESVKDGVLERLDKVIEDNLGHLDPKTREILENAINEEILRGNKERKGMN